MALSHAIARRLGRRAAFAAVCAISVVCTAIDASQADVVVFDTMESERSRELIEGFRLSCPDCGPIDYRSMDGDPRKGDQIVEEIADGAAAGAVDLVIALGGPAARMAVENIRNVPIYYSLVGRAIGGGGPRVQSFEADAPVVMQLAALKAMVPSIETVAVVHDPTYVATMIDTVSNAADRVGIRAQVYRVKSPREVPNAIRAAVRDCDALIFFRDPTVTNRDSVNFIIETTLENRKPTIAYSKTLVDLGLLFTLLPDYRRIGTRMGQAARALIGGGTQDISVPASEADFEVYVNVTSAKQIEGIQLLPNIRRSGGTG